MCHNIYYSLRKLIKSCDLSLWKHYKEAPWSCHWFAYKAVSCFVVVGKYWEGKGKSKPSLYMGGKLLSGINAFVKCNKQNILDHHCPLRLIMVLFFTVGTEFNWRNLTPIRRSCERTIHVSMQSFIIVFIIILYWIMILIFSSYFGW